jgi:hypothetical protein
MFLILKGMDFILKLSQMPVTMYSKLNQIMEIWEHAFTYKLVVWSTDRDELATGGKWILVATL